MASSLSKESQLNTSAGDRKVDSKLMFAECATSLEPVVKEKYKEKISVTCNRPFLVPLQKRQQGCLPQVEACDLLSYLVLDTSYYSNSQFNPIQAWVFQNDIGKGGTLRPPSVSLLFVVQLQPNLAKSLWDKILTRR